MTEKEEMIKVIKKAFEDCGRMLKEQIPRVLSGEIKKASDGTPPLDEAIADALIAAGIGDVKEAERRAEVAEKDLERHKRALYCACKASATVVTKELVKARVDCFLRKAERDLTEGKKQ